MAKTLSFLDKSFWITESDENPKHVACLQLLAMPKGANSAVGFFRLGGGMHINSERGDTCILDGVIVVRLQAP